MIYLDYQATTPLAPEARAAMLPWLDGFGNPHSPHRLGREAAAAVEVARGQVLAALLADTAEDAGMPADGSGIAAAGDRLAASGETMRGAEDGADGERPAILAKRSSDPGDRPVTCVSPEAVPPDGLAEAGPQRHAPEPGERAQAMARTVPPIATAGWAGPGPYPLEGGGRSPGHARTGRPVPSSRTGTAPPGRLVFTGGATEALNWAIKGMWARRAAGRDRIVTVATEHAAVLDTCAALAHEGAEVVVLPVDRLGQVDMAAAGAAIDERTLLVAVMLVNNEIGTIAPVAAIGGLARAAGAAMLCDAVQGFGRVAVPVAACDMIAISAHKIHGPKGIGALWLRDGCVPAPLLHGGGQEHGLRSGTLSPMLCAGFGAAAVAAIARRSADAGHVAGLYDRLRAGLGPAWQVNGDPVRRWHGNLNLRRDGVDAARLISELRGLAFSAGSACASGSGRASHVLKAIGLGDAEARGSIRLGFGRYTTAEETDRAAAMIGEAAERQARFAA